MRLFIAIEMPKELDEEVNELKKKLDTDYAKLTITKDNHLTLKFLGDIEESKAEDIKDSLSRIEFDKYNTRLNNIGVFPNENYIRVVWVGLKPEEETIALKEKIDGVLKDFKDDFEFHPHLTLARVKFIKDKERFKELLKSIKSENSEFSVDEFKLIKSELKPEGPKYSEILRVVAKG